MSRSFFLEKVFTTYCLYCLYFQQHKVYSQGKQIIEFRMQKCISNYQSLLIYYIIAVFAYDSHYIITVITLLQSLYCYSHYIVTIITLLQSFHSHYIATVTSAIVPTKHCFLRQDKVSGNCKLYRK